MKKNSNKYHVVIEKDTLVEVSTTKFMKTLLRALLKSVERDVARVKS